MKKITDARFLKAIDGFSPRIKCTGKKLRGTYDNVYPLSRTNKRLVDITANPVRKAVGERRINLSLSVGEANNLRCILIGLKDDDTLTRRRIVKTLEQKLETSMKTAAQKMSK